MSKTVLQFSLMFVVLVLAQAVIFNRLALFSVALAFVFIYFIIKLPLTLSASKVMWLSFLLGFCVDIFSDTPGINSLACTCLGACRHTVVRLYVPREEDLIHSIPSMRTLGVAIWTKYVVTMSLLFCILVFVIEAFSFFLPWLMLERIVASTVFTSLLIIAIDSLFARSQTLSAGEKRL